jgi:hypothetical protein
VSAIACVCIAVYLLAQIIAPRRAVLMMLCALGCFALANALDAAHGYTDPLLYSGATPGAVRLLIVAAMIRAAKR